MSEIRLPLPELNRLLKWRSVLAGWQLGTRPDTDPEVQAVRDSFEKLLILRAEVTALTRLLVDAGVFTVDQFQDALELEAKELEKAYQRRFPGMKATDSGIEMDVREAARTMEKMHFKP